MTGPTGNPFASKVPALLSEAREHMRKRHLSLKTELAYISTMRRFMEFDGRRHPSKLGAPEISAYLSHLAVHDHVAASTQYVASNALIYLYRNVRMPEAPGIVRAQRRTRNTGPLKKCYTGRCPSSSP